MKFTVARKNGETFNDYKIRRKQENAQMKRRLRGQMVWVAKDITNQLAMMKRLRDGEKDFGAMLSSNTGKGTYIRAKHGELKFTYHL